jgi:hypothetical protein
MVAFPSPSMALNRSQGSRRDSFVMGIGDGGCPPTGRGLFRYRCAVMQGWRLRARPDRIARGAIARRA